MTVNKFKGKAIISIGKKNLDQGRKMRGKICTHLVSSCLCSEAILSIDLFAATLVLTSFHVSSLLGIHFPTYQWSVLKNNFAAIEEAIKHFQKKNE